MIATALKRREQDVQVGRGYGWRRGTGRPFEDFYMPEPNSGCWLWTGQVGVQGYGYYRPPSDGKRHPNVAAYAYSYTRTQTIPSGYELDHTCRVRSCVNPAHLEPVPHRVNMLRGNTFASRNSRKTHCPAGHAYTQDNTAIHFSHGGTHRRCKTCDRARAAARVRDHSRGA